MVVDQHYCVGWVSRAWAFAACCFVSLAIAGCGGGTPFGETDTGVLTFMVMEVNGSAGEASPERFKNLFAAGVAPGEAERKNYAKFMFEVSQVRPAGEQAQLTVVVEDLDDLPVGEVEWTAIREGGAWKLQLAPLP